MPFKDPAKKAAYMAEYRLHPGVSQYHRPKRDRAQVITYKAFNAGGDLIYVGRGHYSRLSSHRQHTPWWSEVVRVQVRKRASSADAMVLEALLIRRHQPRYNVDGVSR